MGRDTLLSVRERALWFAETFVALCGAWLALNGTSAWAAGLVAAGAGAGVGAVLAPGRPSRWRILPALSFARFFLAQSLAGGLDVARRALHPRLPLDPRIVELPLRLPAGPPRTLMLAVVSLVPGSLAVDLDERHNVLHVHLLAGEGTAQLRALEAHVAALFALEPR